VLAQGGVLNIDLRRRIKRYILFHNKRHPSSIGGDEVNAFLTSLATEQNVSASAQN
jgi:hypothetical protein